MMASTEKALVIFPNAKHRHFDSGLCAQTQSAGAIGQADPNAILDLETATSLPTYPSSGVAMDYCGFDTFTIPTDIKPLVASVTGFNVTPTNVPTTGLDTAEMKRNVIELAVTFFGTVLNRSSDDQRPYTDCLLERRRGQPKPTVTQQHLDDVDKASDGVFDIHYVDETGKEISTEEALRAAGRAPRHLTKR
jgi:hypothetical protein